MKKLIAFFLVICFSVFLCACGAKRIPVKEPDGPGNEIGETYESDETVPEKAVLSKEEMLAQAETVEIKKLGLFGSNPTKAKAEYFNKVLLLEGFIQEIKEDHVRMRISDSIIAPRLDVFLPEEDIIRLMYNQKIVIVGILDETITEEEAMSSGSSYTYSIISMSTAYLIQDKFVISGTIWGRIAGTNKFYFFEPGHQYGTELTFADGVDTSAYETGKQKIQVYAKVYQYGLSIHIDNTYSDAVPVE